MSPLPVLKAESTLSKPVVETKSASNKLLLAKFKKEFYLACSEDAINRERALELLQQLEFIEPNVLDLPKAEFMLTLCSTDNIVNSRLLC